MPLHPPGASSPSHQKPCSERTCSWPHNPCAVEGICGGRDNTIGSKERLRCNLHPYERIHACPHLPALHGPHSVRSSTATFSSMFSLKLTGPRSLRNLILLMSAPVLFEISQIAAPIGTRSSTYQMIVLLMAFANVTPASTNARPRARGGVATSMGRGRNGGVVGATIVPAAGQVCCGHAR